MIKNDGAYRFPLRVEKDLSEILRVGPLISIIKRTYMSNEYDEVEILDPEEINEDEFYQLSQELLANNSIYRNMELQFKNLIAS